MTDLNDVDISLIITDERKWPSLREREKQYLKDYGQFSKEDSDSSDCYMDDFDDSDGNEGNPPLDTETEVTYSSEHIVSTNFTSTLNLEDNSHLVISKENENILKPVLDTDDTSQEYIDIYDREDVLSSNSSVNLEDTELLLSSKENVNLQKPVLDIVDTLQETNLSEGMKSNYCPKNDLKNKSFNLNTLDSALFLITHFQEHPKPEDRDGVDIKATYEFLRRIISGKDSQRLSHQTERFIWGLILDLEIDFSTTPKGKQYFDKLKIRIQESFVKARTNQVQ